MEDANVSDHSGGKGYPLYAPLGGALDSLSVCPFLRHCLHQFTYIQTLNPEIVIFMFNVYQIHYLS